LKPKPLSPAALVPDFSQKKQIFLLKHDTVIKGPYVANNERDETRVKNCQLVLVQLQEFGWFGNYIRWKVYEKQLWLCFENTCGGRHDNGDAYHSSGLYNVQRWGNFPLAGNMKTEKLWYLILLAVTARLVEPCLVSIDLDHFIRVYDGGRFQLRGIDQCDEKIQFEYTENLPWYQALLTKFPLAEQLDLWVKSIAENKYELHVALENLRIHVARSQFATKALPKFDYLYRLLQEQLIGTKPEELVYLGMPVMSNDLVWIYDEKPFIHQTTFFSKFEGLKPLLSRKRKAAVIVDNVWTQRDDSRHSVYDGFGHNQEKRIFYNISEVGEIESNQLCEIHPNHVALMKLDEIDQFKKKLKVETEILLQENSNNQFKIGDLVFDIDLRLNVMILNFVNQNTAIVVTEEGEYIITEINNFEHEFDQFEVVNFRPVHNICHKSKIQEILDKIKNRKYIQDL